MNIKIWGYVIFLLTLLSIPALAETPFDRADGVLRLGTDDWIPGRDDASALTRLKAGSVTIEIGETFKNLNHDFAFFSADLTITNLLIKEFWIRPLLSFQPNFDNFNVSTLKGTSQLQFGFHLNGPWADHWEKTENGDLKLKEVNMWIWFHLGKDHNGPWNSGFYVDFRPWKWLALKGDFLGWGTRENPFPFSRQQSDLTIEFLIEIDWRWTFTISGTAHSYGPFGSTSDSPGKLKGKYIWQIGIEYRG